ncbi:MAG: NAD(P)-binding domain-containing protein [Bacteroidales bacterium]
MKKIGIIGSGEVGKALAKGLNKHGYLVMLGSEDKNKRDSFKNETGIMTGTFSEAAVFGEVVILAVKGLAAGSVVSSLATKIAGKTVIDTCNPIAEKPPVNGVLQFFTSLDDSLMERLQGMAPSANFVKAFSCVGSTFMIDPSFTEKPSMFICGNNEAARKEVREILDNVGWAAEDMGGAEAARAIEPLCMLWCIPGFRSNDWAHAFRMVRP